MAREIDGIATLEKELSDEDEAVAVVNWIWVNRDGYVSHRHVVDGLKALQLGEFKPVIVARGTTSSAPHKQDVAQPVVAAQPAPATTLPDLEAGLPPLPQWVIQKLGSNKLTNSALAKMSTQFRLGFFRRFIVESTVQLSKLG